MARPTKIGLEYFSLDVDLFEDEKVIPISSEFGAKGECVLIRVLCAIYRNGYFAECSEAFKYKIAKQANVSQNLVSEVITGLVRWRFFDESVFNSFNVITSRGIQKRWKEATRKRVSKNELDFWICEFPAEETRFLAEETPLNRSESTQSKVKEIKVNKREKKQKEISPPENQIYFIPISEIENYMCSDIQWIEVMCMQNHLTEIALKQKIKEFVQKLRAENVKEKHKNDCFQHFSNWLKYPKKSENSKSNITKLTGNEQYTQF